MKQVFGICKLNLLLLWRHKIFQAATCVSLVATFAIFYVISGNDEAVQEAQLRIQYSLGIGYTLISLFYIFAACFLVRSQLDNRNIHLITSHPVSRPKIILGQFLALFSSALATLFLLYCLLGLLLYAQYNTATPAQKAELSSHYSQASYNSLPLLPPLEQQALNFLKRKNLTRDQLKEAEFEYLKTTLYRRSQNVGIGEEKTWPFQVNNLESQTLTLQLKLMTRSHLRALPLELQIFQNNKAISESIALECHPIRKHSIPFQLKEALISNQVTVLVRNKSNKELIFSRLNGLQLQSLGKGQVANILSAYGLHACHLSLLIVLGMPCGTLLQFAVGGLLSLVAYLFSFANNFIQKLIEVDPASLTNVEKASRIIVKYALKVTHSFQSPDIISPLSNSHTIQGTTQNTPWLPFFAISLLLTLLITMLILNKKELDKVQV